MPMLYHRAGSRVHLLLKGLLFLLAGIALLAVVWSGWNIHRLSDEKRQHKLAYAFVHNVSFGLLSVDVWRDQVVATTRKELSEFRLTAEQEQDLRKEINKQLQGLIDQAFAEINKPKKSLGDKLKKAAINTLVDQSEVEKEIPGFSRRIVTVLTSPASYKRVTNIADTAITQISRKIYDSSVAATKDLMTSIYRSYGATDKASFERSNQAVTDQLQHKTIRYSMVMMGGALLLLALWVIFRRNNSVRVPVYVSGVLASLALLAAGTSITIIEMDATLAKMDIRFLSGALSFNRQSLFFQSQSLLDVIHLLLDSGNVASIIVGLMIGIFCILFPAIILVASGWVAANAHKATTPRWITKLAFHSDKWNMSDVMAVAILMTYIGFNGIVNSTLSSLNYSEGSITSVTDNKTALEPGYFIYTAFVVISTCLLFGFKRKFKQEAATSITGTNEVSHS